jgi:hypothetical protein
VRHEDLHHAVGLVNFSSKILTALRCLENLKSGEKTISIVKCRRGCRSATLLEGPRETGNPRQNLDVARKFQQVAP